jgi:hypothetical protein
LIDKRADGRFNTVYLVLLRASGGDQDHETGKPETERGRAAMATDRLKLLVVMLLRPFDWAKFWRRAWSVFVGHGA